MKYSHEDLVRVAKRQNNNKRGYLVVNPMQGKHVPVSPGKALQLFDDLAKVVENEFGEDKLLVIGFAETATAIGAQVAISLNAKYIQTTREIIPDVDYIYFSEAHSHATEQKLVKDDMDAVMKEIDRIVFVEDEVTTGNTIMNIITILRRMYSQEIQFSVLSLLNGMDESALSKYEEQGISVFYLLKTNHETYDEIANTFAGDGAYHDCKDKVSEAPFVFYNVEGKLNPRRLLDSKAYDEANQKLAQAVMGRFSFDKSQRILVIGSEECMYPALYVGSRIEEAGCVVKCHSTTRSPIEVSSEDTYPLKARYELNSLYDRERRTFIYNLDKYDGVIIITDSELKEQEGLLSLISALALQNSNISVFRWY